MPLIQDGSGQLAQHPRDEVGWGGEEGQVIGMDKYSESKALQFFANGNPQSLGSVHGKVYYDY